MTTAEPAQPSARSAQPSAQAAQPSARPVADTIADTSPTIVSLRSASFGYADRAVVSDVSLDVRAGEVVAVLGPNGSGKSTLVKGLLGLNTQMGGDVSLFGTPFADFHDHARLGYVPQRHTLSASVRATVEEIVAIGRLPHQSWLARPNRRDKEIVCDSLDLVGLGDRAREDVSTLSGGQQRRVLIARALAAQPDVLIMDEPTAGVDTASQQVLAEVLVRLAGRGTTMLIVTHELQPLRDVLTRIVAMSAGHVAFDGPLDGYARFQQSLVNLPGGHGGHDGHHHHGADDLTGHGGHHHDEDPPRDIAGTPSSGPLDPRGEHHA